MGDDLERYSVNLASSCLSLFGSAAIILNYIIFANKSQLLYKLIFFLSLADFGGSLAISISQIFLFLHTYDGYGYGLDLCKVFRAGVNFFFVSSFFWTSGISLHIWICAKQKAQIPIYWFHLVCWGIPAICISVLLGADMITQSDGSASWCSNTVLGHWLFWYLPLLLSFTWNAIAYTLILVHYHRGEGPDRAKMKDKIKLRISLYLFVFFICWIWDVVNFSWEQVTHGHSPYWLQLLTSAFLPLQGFLNFLVYGLSSRMFRRPPTKHSSLRRSFAINSQSPLLSPSLSHPHSLSHSLSSHSNSPLLRSQSAGQPHSLSLSPSSSSTPNSYRTNDERRGLLSP